MWGFINTLPIYVSQYTKKRYSTSNYIIFLKNDILVSNNISIAANIWLGGSDILSDGSWVWVGSDEAFSYTGWYPTEPNNYHGGEHCALMMFNNNQDWADTNCASKNSFICETSA